MTTSKLAAIAERMRAAVSATPFGWTNHQLPGGLEIVLSHNGEKWRMALRREKVFPSEVEERILAQAFGVAEGSEPQRRIDKQKYIVEYNWREAE